MENGRRLGFAMDEDLIIKGDSTRLAPADITSRIGPARFFSIDGGIICTMFWRMRSWRWR